MINIVYCVCKRIKLAAMAQKNIVKTHFNTTLRVLIKWKILEI